MSAPDESHEIYQESYVARIRRHFLRDFFARSSLMTILALFIVGSVSAMMTLRERKTQYGIIVNLPIDHTAASVNAAVIAAPTARGAPRRRWARRHTAAGRTSALIS